MEWPRGKKEPACSKNRKKGIVVGAQQMGAQGVWIAVEEVVRASSCRTFLKVCKCQDITWSTVGNRVLIWLELDFLKDHPGSSVENGLEREG